MRFIKYFTVFVIAFAVAWILIVTFTQEPFATTVPLKFFTYQTVAFPIYFFVIGAFALGLLIGLLTAILNFVNLKGQLHRKLKEMKNLESELASLRSAMGNVIKTEIVVPVNIEKEALKPEDKGRSAETS